MYCRRPSDCKSSQTRPTSGDAQSGRRDRSAEYPRPIRACVSVGEGARAVVPKPGGASKPVGFIDKPIKESCHGSWWVQMRNNQTRWPRLSDAQAGFVFPTVLKSAPGARDTKALLGKRKVTRETE